MTALYVWYCFSNINCINRHSTEIYIQLNFQDTARLTIYSCCEVNANEYLCYDTVDKIKG